MSLHTNSFRKKKQIHLFFLSDQSSNTYSLLATKRSCFLEGDKNPRLFNLNCSAGSTELFVSGSESILGIVKQNELQTACSCL